MSRASTPTGRRYLMPWRVTWYMRDHNGRPFGGGRRAFTLGSSAHRQAEVMRAAGYHVEVWRQDPLPGVR